MENAFVSWRDYEGLEGFGASSAVEVQELRKALAAGQDVNSPGVSAGAGFPLRIESLEKTLKVVTYRMDDVRLWKNITKLPAYNTVEEYNRLREYGSGVAGFIAEGDAPSSDDSTYSREFTIIKFAGTTRSVTHVMSLVRPAHGPVIAQETVNGTAWLLKQIEQKLFFGNATNVPVEWDGLQPLIIAGAPAANVIDLRGMPLSEDILNDAALTVKTAPNYGRPTDLYCADGAYSDLAKSFYPAERIPLQPGGYTDGMVGLQIKGFHSMVGPVMFNPDVFIDFGALIPGAAIGDVAKRPTVPTENVAPVDGGADLGNGKWTASYIGDYRWAVVAVNRYGKSTALAMTGPFTAVLAHFVTMAVTEGAVIPSCYEVYRTNKSGAAATAKYAFTVPATHPNTTITDYNLYLPGMSSAFLLQQNIEFFSFKQLCPFVKIPLATIDTSIRWMQLLYGAPTVYAPGKSILFRNVGRAPASVGGGGA